MMSREEVIAAVKKAAEELGEIPTQDWLLEHQRVTAYEIRKHFGQFRRCLEACGLRSHRQGYELADRELLLDWAAVVRQTGKVPSVLDYHVHGRYSVQPLRRAFGVWGNIPAAMLEWAKKECLEEHLKDVLEIAANHLHATTASGRISMGTTGLPFQPRILKDEPIYGAPMTATDLLLEPTNEQGVIFLFGGVARKLGFAMLKIQTEYPDGEAMREVAPGRWQRVKLEFEEESKNFLPHKHDPAKCHLIVCWKHNWPECPLEVIELKSLLKKLRKEEE